MKFYDHSCTVLQGVSQSGKTFFMKRLIQQKEHMFFTKVTKVIVVFDKYQPAYDDMARATDDITFLPQIPNESELKALTKDHAHTVLILDDQIGKLETSKDVADIFVKNSHHHRISCFLLLQANNLTGKKYGAEIIRNCHYSILFKSGQIGGIVKSLALRLNDYARLTKAYAWAVAQSNYSYLVVNTHPRAQPIERYSTRVLPDETPCIILTDSINIPAI